MVLLATMLGYPPLPAEGPCASPLPLSVAWERAGLAASGDEKHPPTGVSNDDTNTCIVIRAVY